jgi:uncharacterized Zn finger protein
MSWRHGYWREFYPKSRPRRARGGIRAQSTRGSFGESWWARRWIEVLEGFRIGARLGRGRSYARQGQVLSVEIEKGRVRSKVQGSRPKPYEVAIAVKTLSKAEWTAVVRAFAVDAALAAKLLAGSMPGDIEKAFRKAGASLFPRRYDDLKTDCSCPDWSNPCKHVAAVYYLLGEEFDRDPFLVFKLRGIDREELVDLLGSRGTQKTTRRAKREAAVEAQEPGGAAALREPLPTDAQAFWTGGGLAGIVVPGGGTPGANAAMIRRLGCFPFWRGTEPFADAMDRAYAGAASRGTEILLRGRADFPVGHGEDLHMAP